MGRVTLLDKSCARKTSLADGPRNRCPFSIHRTSTSRRKLAQLWEKVLSNNPIFGCIQPRLLYPVVSLETPCLFFTLSNRGSDLGDFFGHNAQYSGKARGQRDLWKQVTTASFSHASRAHLELCWLPRDLTHMQVPRWQPSFRNDPKTPLVSSATSQAWKYLIHWDGSWEVGNNIP